MMNPQLKSTDFRIVTGSHPDGILHNDADVALISRSFGRALDGIVAQARTVPVDLAAVEPWMTGLRWVLLAADDRSWTLRNQGESNHCLVGLPLDGDVGAVVLDRCEPGWMGLSSRWTIYKSTRTKSVMLRNGGGGWLAMGETGAFLSKRKTADIGAELLWDLVDAATLLEPSPSPQSAVPVVRTRTLFRWLRRAA